MLLKVLAASQALLENFVGTVVAIWVSPDSSILSVPWVCTHHITSTSRAVSPHSPVTEVLAAGHIPPEVWVKTQSGVSGGDHP